MKKYCAVALWLLFVMPFAKGNPIVMEVYQCTDASKTLDFDTVVKNNDFRKVADISHLNFGISQANYWLKIVVKNTLPEATYKLVLATITPDTIEVYALNQGILQKTLMGEAIPSNERFLTYYFKPTDTPSVFYLKITGDGQPIALPMHIVRTDLGDDLNSASTLFSGLLYGIISFILIINLVLYKGTSEKLYLYFSLFNLFSTGVILYFDGFIKLLFIPDSAYWNNQSIIIALCGSFISVNYYYIEFLKIKVHKPALERYFTSVNILFLAIGGLSFWHPTGFNLYIKFNLVMTSVEASLLFVSLVLVRRKEKEYFAVQLMSIFLLIIFGTIVQLYFFGFLSINLLTRYAVHGMILPQILIQTFALGRRFTFLAQERLALQSSLLATSEQYSQSLISTLENERKRLSSEFHDSIGQNLLVIRNRILLMLRQNYTDSQREKLDGLATITSETLDEIRAISQNLRPTTLDTIGLTASLNNMLERLKRSTNIDISFICPQNIDETIAKDLEINVYRILQELMNNVLKHSKANEATVTITKQTNDLLLQIKDDGVGFDVQDKTVTSTGNGFTSIKERVKILKGEMTIVSKMEEGTLVNIKIPTKKYT